MSLVRLQGLLYLQSIAGKRWDDPGATFKATLLKGTHTEDQTTQYLADVTGDQIAQTFTDETLATGSVSVVGSSVVLDVADITFSALAAGDTPGFLCVYADTGVPATSAIVGTFSINSPPAPNGTDWTLVVNASGGLVTQTPV